MRLALIGDTHGYVPALEAALGACRAAAPDLIIHCGDFISTPFSPDPPGETVALLRAAGVRAICGNGEAYLRDWGTERWETTLAQRRARADSPDYFLPYVPAGQAELSACDLTWLRHLPDELTLDGARPGDVYVCHGMPGNPFSTVWEQDPRYDGHITAEARAAALSRPGPAGADLILCGHTHVPLVQRTALPNGRTALVVRGGGVADPRGDPDQVWHTGCAILTHVGGPVRGYSAWEITIRTVPFTPRDPSWTWEQPSRKPC
jgi:predicted phosphodiesterase